MPITDSQVSAEIGLLPFNEKTRKGWRPYSRGPAERKLNVLLLRTTAAAPAISAETAVATGVFYAPGIPITHISLHRISSKGRTP